MTTIRKDPLFRLVSYALVLGAVVSGASGQILLAVLLAVAAFACLAVRLTFAIARSHPPHYLTHGSSLVADTVVLCAVDCDESLRSPCWERAGTAHGSGRFG